MAKVHAITFLISCEYVSVNWSDSSLKHETPLRRLRKEGCISSDFTKEWMSSGFFFFF